MFLALFSNKKSKFYLSNSHHLIIFITDSYGCLALRYKECALNDMRDYCLLSAKVSRTHVPCM